MNKRIVVLTIAIAAVAVLLSGCLTPDTEISYQGQLTDAAGNPVPDGDYQVTFRLYTEDDDPVGDAIWTETQTVNVSQGLFNVKLGSVSDLQAAAFAQQLWLGVEVEGDGEMRPRQKLSGAPFAMSLVPGAAMQGSVNLGDEHPGMINIQNVGTGVGVAVSSWGKAGLAVDGAFNPESGDTTVGEHGILIDNVQTGGVITATEGNGLKVVSTGGGASGDDGVRAESVGDGVVGNSSGTTNQDYGVYAYSAGGRGLGAATGGAGQYAGYFFDPIFVDGGVTGGTLSYMAQNATDGALQKGDPVRAAGVDTSLKGLQTPVLKVAQAKADEPVLGVVVGRSEIIEAEGELDDDQTASFGPVGGPAKPGDYMVIIVQGPAQVRAGAAESIQAGSTLYLDSGLATATAGGAPLGMALDEVDADGLVWVMMGVH